MLTYFIIFTSKIIENALSTLRLIVVSNGKKKLGAILQGIIGLVWIFVTGMVIINVNEAPIKIIVFCIGSMFGSYLGSVLEEKIAMGTNMLICVVNDKYENTVKEKLNNYQIITLCEKDKNYSILFIIMKRKETNNISKLIKEIDNNAILISEKIKTINNIV